MPKRVKIGKVVSDKMDKTIVVAIVSKQPHPMYGKYQATTVKFKAHDEENIAKAGDEVSIEEFRPLSRTKRWRLVSVLKEAQEV